MTESLTEHFFYRNTYTPLYSSDYLINYVPTVLCINPGQHLWVMFTSITRIETKCDLCDFDCGMIVGARWAVLSNFITADLLRFSHPIISKVYSDWCNKEKNIQ